MKNDSEKFMADAGISKAKLSSEKIAITALFTYNGCISKNTDCDSLSNTGHCLFTGYCCLQRKYQFKETIRI